MRGRWNAITLTTCTRPIIRIRKYNVSVVLVHVAAIWLVEVEAAVQVLG